MEDLIAQKTFNHVLLGSIDQGQEFSCETKLANKLIKDKLATKVKAEEDK